MHRPTPTSKPPKPSIKGPWMPWRCPRRIWPSSCPCCRPNCWRNSTSTTTRSGSGDSATSPRTTPPRSTAHRATSRPSTTRSRHRTWPRSRFSRGTSARSSPCRLWAGMRRTSSDAPSARTTPPSLAPWSTSSGPGHWPRPTAGPTTTWRDQDRWTSRRPPQRALALKPTLRRRCR